MDKHRSSKCKQEVPMKQCHNSTSALHVVILGVKTNVNKHIVINMTNNANKWVIAVHCGAGYHSPKNSQKYKDIMSEACRAASLILSNKNTENNCIEAVTQAITILENCPFTNAGTGSNLTERGTVECDACIVSGKHRSLFGSVGAVMGVKNPIQLAKELLYDCNRGIGTLGRIKPLMLVGKGAWQYCLKQPHCSNIQRAKNEQELVNYLVTEKSRQVWNDNSNKLKQAEQDDQFYDTVGAVCMDMDGNICSGVSSGGISLKYEGRVGEAAVFGSGCFAEQEKEYGFGCSCTGVGEDIMYNRFAQQCSYLLKANSNDDEDGIYLDSCLTRVLSTEYSALLPHHNSRNAGILALHRDQGSIELGWGYTTKTMAVAYLSNSMTNPVSFVSNNKSSSIQVGMVSV
jgi:taspase (threonine aspartase 1)